MELQSASTSPLRSPFVAHAHSKGDETGSSFYFHKLQRKVQRSARAYHRVTQASTHQRTHTHTHLSSRLCPHLRMPGRTAAICPTCLLRAASPDYTAPPSGEHRGCRIERGHKWYHHGCHAAFTFRHAPQRLPPALDDRGQGEAAAADE